MVNAVDIVGGAHGRFVHARRVRRIAGAIAPLLRPGWRVLDVGCGDGRIGALVRQLVGELEVEGYEVAARPGSRIPVKAFDGRRIPEDDGAFDAVMMVDMLHHAEDPEALLGEAARVAKRAVIVKDHRLNKPFAASILAFMDRVGNTPHGVASPCDYWDERRWHDAWSRLGLTVQTYQTALGLYPWPVSWVCESGLHFLAALVPGGRADDTGGDA